MQAITWLTCDVLVHCLHCFFTWAGLHHLDKAFVLVSLRFFSALGTFCSLVALLVEFGNCCLSEVAEFVELGIQWNGKQAPPRLVRLVNSAIPADFSRSSNWSAPCLLFQIWSMLQSGGTIALLAFW